MNFQGFIWRNVNDDSFKGIDSILCYNVYLMFWHFLLTHQKSNLIVNSNTFLTQMNMFLSTVKIKKIFRSYD